MYTRIPYSLHVIYLRTLCVYGPNTVLLIWYCVLQLQKIGFIPVCDSSESERRWLLSRFRSDAGEVERSGRLGRDEDEAPRAMARAVEDEGLGSCPAESIHEVSAARGDASAPPPPLAFDAVESFRRRVRRRRRAAFEWCW